MNVESSSTMCVLCVNHEQEAKFDLGVTFLHFLFFFHCQEMNYLSPVKTKLWIMNFQNREWFSNSTGWQNKEHIEGLRTNEEGLFEGLIFPIWIKQVCLAWASMSVSCKLICFSAKHHPVDVVYSNVSRLCEMGLLNETEPWKGPKLNWGTGPTFVYFLPGSFARASDQMPAFM